MTIPSLAMLLVLAACGSGPAADPSQPAPDIVVLGIAEGAVYDGMVAIQISVDRGDFQATLDGAPYTSGDTIRTPGSHVLTVSAHSGAAMSSRDIHFSIRAPDGGALIIRMFNLGPNEDGGGGDAILVTDSSAAGMVHVMIDAGPAGVGASDTGYVARQLAALHVDTLFLLLLTHAHADHFGGMPAVLSGVKVRRFLYNGQVRSLTSYNTVISKARVVADSVITVTALRDYDLGLSSQPSHITFVPPLATNLATTTDDGTLLNDGSVAARLVLGNFSMFFTGDGEVNATARWRTQFSSLIHGVTVLKVGHHGANNAIFDNGLSGTSSWLDQVLPSVSIVSGNGTSHPRINALARLLAQSNNRTYCTNVHGMIELRVTRAGALTVSVEKNADQQCVAGSEATS